jgi:hypothetical protein
MGAKQLAPIGRGCTVLNGVDRRRLRAADDAAVQEPAPCPLKRIIIIIICCIGYTIRGTAISFDSILSQPATHKRKAHKRMNNDEPKRWKENPSNLHGRERELETMAEDKILPFFSRGRNGLKVLSRNLNYHSGECFFMHTRAEPSKNKALVI